jgi:hypothetical protein
MFNYLAFLHSGVPQAGGGASESPFDDGRALATECLEKLKTLDPKQFPPKLLILLASPKYFEVERATQLIDGIHSLFTAAGHGNIALIGSSVAAVFFNGKVHEDGALLICLASRMLEVQVEVSSSVSFTPESSVKNLLAKLNLDSESGEDPNPFVNRILFTFLPGHTEQGYIATRLHRNLRDGVRSRVPIVGGVSSSSGEANAPGLQFANKGVYQDVLVAARATIGTALGVSINNGLHSTSYNLHITEMADQYTISRFNGNPARDEIIGLQQTLEGKFIVLGKLVYNSDSTVEYPQIVNDPEPSIKLLRPAKSDEVFRVLTVDPKKLDDSTSASVEHSCQSFNLSNPVGCLGFRCSGYVAYHKQIRLNLEQEIRQVEEKLQIPGSYVGGFFDGEMGMDKQGQSLLRTWSTAAVVFGDELRPRTPVIMGFDKLAEFLSNYPAEGKSPEESVQALLNTIYALGYPGVRLYMFLKDHDGNALVTPTATSVIGSLALPDPKLYPLIIKLPDDESGNEGPIVRAFRGQADPFFPYNLLGEPTSRYITPLKTVKGTPIAVLEIDLGIKKGLSKVEAQLLEQLGIIVGASLIRIFTWQEAQIRHAFNDAFRKSLLLTNLKDGLEQYLQEAAVHLGIQMWHIREARTGYRLELLMGSGPYYEIASKLRETIDIGDPSPTTKAYHDHITTIINDAAKKPAHQGMIEGWSRTPGNPEHQEMRRILEKVHSYANIYFVSASGTEGTINLVSFEPWFFTYYRTRVLPSLREHVGLLIDHFGQKEAARGALTREEEIRKKFETAHSRIEHNNKLSKFILGVSSHINRLDLDNFTMSLQRILDHFVEKAKAEVGSLYVWDPDRNLYILRAEHGWFERNCVNVACYNKEAGWFGARALESVPRYIKDLHKFYEDTPGSVKQPGGLYAEWMFGEKLSDEFTVEALGFPLKTRSGQPLGVIALYNPLHEGKPQRFLRTLIDASDVAQYPDDLKVLGELGYSVASTLSALMQRQADKVEESERKLRLQISDELYHWMRTEPQELSEVPGSFEKLICKILAAPFQTSRISFCRKREKQPEDSGPEFEVAATLPEGMTIAGAPAHLAPADLLELNWDRYEKKLNNGNINASDIFIKRKELSDTEHDNPRASVTENQAEHMWLPLSSGQELIGMIYLHWDGSRPQNYEESNRYIKKYFWQLSERLGAIYRLYLQSQALFKAKEEIKQREVTRKRLQSRMTLVAASTHTFKSIINNMKNILNQQGMSQNSSVYEELRPILDDFDRKMFRLMQIAEKEDLYISPKYLQPIMKNALVDCGLLNPAPGMINWIIDDPLNLQALVDSELIGVAFTNIVENAVKYTPPSGVLTIKTEPVLKEKKVRITFIDNGPGIEQGICDSINAGKYRKFGDHWGLFLILSVIDCHDGQFYISNREDGESGTIMTLTLPC